MLTLPKAVEAVLDYGWDWTDWLDTDAISSHEISVSPANAVTIDSSSENSGVVTVWISGGVKDTHAIVTCKITTGQSRIDSRSILLKIDER